MDFWPIHYSARQKMSTHAYVIEQTLKRKFMTILVECIIHQKLNAILSISIRITKTTPTTQMIMKIYALVKYSDFTLLKSTLHKTWHAYGCLNMYPLIIMKLSGYVYIYAGLTLHELNGRHAHKIYVWHNSTEPRKLHFLDLSIYMYNCSKHFIERTLRIHFEFGLL